MHGSTISGLRTRFPWRIVTSVVVGIASIPLLVGMVLYHSVLPDFGTLRPLSVTPVGKLSYEELAEAIQFDGNYYFLPTVVDNLLGIESKLGGNDKVRLDLADSYLFASPNGKTGIYSLKIFCYLEQDCVFGNAASGKSYGMNVLSISLGTKSEREAQRQLEVMRRLIVLAGGNTAIDPTKGLARVEYDYLYEGRYWFSGIVEYF